MTGRGNIWLHTALVDPHRRERWPWAIGWTAALARLRAIPLRA